jgi:hypothetical protein
MENVYTFSPLIHYLILSTQSTYEKFYLNISKREPKSYYKMYLCIRDIFFTFNVFRESFTAVRATKIAQVAGRHAALKECQWLK